MNNSRKDELFYSMIDCLWERSIDCTEFVETMKWIGFSLDELLEINAMFCDSDDLEDVNATTRELY